MIRLVTGFAIGFIFAWLSPLWATGGAMSASLILRILALVCFVFAAFGFNPAPVGMLPLGLAFWVGSSLP